MEEDVTTAALDRLQTSLQQLDSAIDRMLARPAADGGRDDRLRDEVRKVVYELDRMIGGNRG